MHIHSDHCTELCKMCHTSCTDSKLRSKEDLRHTKSSGLVSATAVLTAPAEKATLHILHRYDVTQPHYDTITVNSLQNQHWRKRSSSYRARLQCGAESALPMQSSSTHIWLHAIFISKGAVQPEVQPGWSEKRQLVFITALK